MTGNTRDELVIKQNMLKKNDDNKNIYNITTPEYQMILDVIQARENTSGHVGRDDKVKEYQKQVAEKTKLKLQSAAKLKGIKQSQYSKQIDLAEQTNKKELQDNEVEQNKITQGILESQVEYLNLILNPITQILNESLLLKNSIPNKFTNDFIKPSSNLYLERQAGGMIGTENQTDISNPLKEKDKVEEIKVEDNTNEVVKTDQKKGAKAIVPNPNRRKLTPDEMRRHMLNIRINRVKRGLFAPVQMPQLPTQDQIMFPRKLNYSSFKNANFRALSDYILRNTEIPCLMTRNHLKLSKEDARLAHRLLHFAITTKNTDLLAVAEKACGLYDAVLNTDLRLKYQEFKTEITQSIGRLNLIKIQHRSTLYQQSKHLDTLTSVLLTEAMSKRRLTCLD